MTRRARKKPVRRIAEAKLEVLRIRAAGILVRHVRQKRYVTGEDGAPYEAMLPGCRGCTSGLTAALWPCEAAQFAQVTLDNLGEPQERYRPRAYVRRGR